MMQEMYQWGVMREVKRGDLKALFVNLIVLVGKANGRAAQSETKYHVYMDFSKANDGMCWPTHSAPTS